MKKMTKTNVCNMIENKLVNYWAFESWKKLNHCVSEYEIDKLFHYTYDSNFRQIVENDFVKLRFSRADEFLDKNEGIQILEPFYSACGILYDTHKIDKDFFLIARGISADDVRYNSRGTWIFCFSKNGYSDFMKVRYAPNDGWVLGFSAFNLWHLCYDFPGECIRLEKVIYSFRKMRNEFKKKLINIYNCYCHDRANEIYKDDIKLQSDLKKALISCLIEYCFCYKNSAYKNEEEIRLICCPQEGFAYWESDDSCAKLFFGVHEHLPRLYLELKKDQYLMSSSENMDVCDTTELNKCYISSTEIKHVTRKSSKNM